MLDDKSRAYEPFKDTNNESEDALSADVLRDQIVQMAQEDARLQPLIMLINAAANPDADNSQSIREATAQMMAFTKGAPIPTKATVPIKKLPFFEHGHRSYENVQKIKVGSKESVQFVNWGNTVEFETGNTLEVKTVQGVCDIVKWAKGNGKRVRVAGFRHTWSDLYGENGDIIIMFLPYICVAELPYKEPPSDWESELSGIGIVESVAGKSAPAGQAFCKVMAGTTNERFRKWCYSKKTWCIPFNVVMVDITFGGSNAPICHGSGLSTTTLSDLVMEVEYVDANGELQIVNDKEELKAASGCFGLLGVVVSLTLLLDDMGVVEMMPVKQHFGLAVPFPKGYNLPRVVKAILDADGIEEGSSQLAEARAEFIKRCRDDYYLEWFWFPYQKQCWVNTWKKKPKGPNDTNLSEYPKTTGPVSALKHPEISSSAVNALVEFPPFKWLSGQKQAYIYGIAAMVGRPNIIRAADRIRTYVSEALHFRRGILNFRCRDSEWEIPIPTVNGERDYEMIQRAWWDGISAMYERKDAPVRLTLEMRLTGGSNVLLAPQRGNSNGTVSIEVLTQLETPKGEWQSFMQLIANKWTMYTDLDGNPLIARPHWAKQWAGLTIDSNVTLNEAQRKREKDQGNASRRMPIEEYFKEVAYKDAFQLFRASYTDIIAKRNSTVHDTLKVFGAKTMTHLIFPEYE